MKTNNVVLFELVLYCEFTFYCYLLVHVYS